MECIIEIVSTVIATFATVAMAIFTACLWCSTNKLWKTTKQSIELAKKSIDLGREEFIAAYPPKLRIHSIVLHDSSVIDGKSKITFDITNVGGNNAHIVERNITFAKLDTRPNSPPYSGDNPELSIKISLERGRSAGQFLPVDQKIIENIHRLQSAGQADASDYYILGYIDYLDDFNFSGRSAFCRRYNIKTKSFTKIEDESYEYNSY